MNKSKIFYLGIFAFTIFLGVTILYYLDQTVLAEPSLRESKNPCWFKAYDDKSIDWDEIMARQNREMHGYSREVSIESAVRKFNQEMRCYPHYAEFDDLTESEVVASLIDFDSANDEPNYSEPRRNERTRMIKNRVLPKGSLLQFGSGICEDKGSLRESLCAKGLRISLTLNLDKKEDVKIPSLKEDMFIIRKIFPKTEPRQ